MPASDPLLGQLLTEYGPWFLLAMTWAETSFVTGLVVPAGVATAMGAFLAAQGHLPLGVVAAASGLGAWAGDLTGFWVGRRFGRSTMPRKGVLGRWVQRYEPRASHFFGRHPIYGVTGARLVSFVRTLMPGMAGMSSLTFPRFVAYDIPGVAGYVAMYVAIGTVAGESWQTVVQWVGTGGALIAAAVALVLWILAKRKSKESGKTGSHAKGEMER